MISEIGTYNRRQFLKLGGSALIGMLFGGFMVPAVCSITHQEQLLELFLKDMAGWDTSHIDKDMLILIGTGALAEESRAHLYETAFQPNKKYYIHGWGTRRLGHPGMFSI